MISHHTAILGVTGSGKTHMVFKLMKPILDNGYIMICIDITGEYQRRFVKEGINFKKYSDCIGHPMGDILMDCLSGKKALIIDWDELSNTEQSIKQTQELIEKLIKYAKVKYISGVEFKCCIVLEEAHTLVPQDVAVNDWEAKALVTKLSQISLQGRKYNVGFIILSQRTATVQKTVLNQCNTMISFRAYDETSFNFLSSYYGDDYAREIIHLKNDGDSRYVLVAGKAVVADRPIIVEVKK